jgi:hypothetical protein
MAGVSHSEDRCVRVSPLPRHHVTSTGDEGKEGRWMIQNSASASGLGDG